MTNPKDTTGKRWWEEEIIKTFSVLFGVTDIKWLLSFIAKVADKEYDRGYDEAMDYVKIIEKKVREEGFRKGVEASLGALDESSLKFMSCGCLQIAKENIGNLIKKP